MSEILHHNAGDDGRWERAIRAIQRSKLSGSVWPQVGIKRHRAQVGIERHRGLFGICGDRVEWQSKSREVWLHSSCVVECRARAQ